MLLDEILDRARAKGRGPALLIGREFFAQPGHGTVEVMEGQPVHARDVIVGHPLLAAPVRAGDHDPVQHGGEDGPLDRELEAAPGEEILDHGAAAGLLPQAPEQQGCADALAGKPLGVAGLELREKSLLITARVTPACILASVSSATATTISQPMTALASPVAMRVA